MSALTTSSDATAGYSFGTYPSGVPSLRTEPSAITRSPILISGWAAPQVPTRINVCTPSSFSSSTPIATEGPPHAGRHGGPRHAVELARERSVLAAKRDFASAAKIFGDQRRPKWIARHEH